MQKSELLGYKTIKIGHMKFTIKRINPILDFPIGHMPQIFTAFTSRRDNSKAIDPRVVMEQMMRVVEAGTVSPEFVPVGIGDKKGKEVGVTVDDLFHDSELGAKLFTEIIFHSLNQHRGLKSLFFSLKNRLRFWMLSQNDIVKDLQI
jgi:hypothetical protein